MNRPPVTLSSTVADFARTAGCRNVLARTAIPTHLPGTRRASAAAIVSDSNAGPFRSRLASERWSLIQPALNASISPASAQVSSRRCQSSPADPVGAIRKPTSPKRQVSSDVAVVFMAKR